MVVGCAAKGGQWSVGGMDTQADRGGGGHPDMEVEFEVTLPITALRHAPCHSVWNLEW